MCFMASNPYTGLGPYNRIYFRSQESHRTNTNKGLLRVVKTGVSVFVLYDACTTE